MLISSVFQIIGCAAMIGGVWLFLKDNRIGTNAVKLPGVEISFSAPSLVVFITGAILFVFPFTSLFHDQAIIGNSDPVKAYPIASPPVISPTPSPSETPSPSPSETPVPSPSETPIPSPTSYPSPAPFLTVAPPAVASVGTCNAVINQARQIDGPCNYRIHTGGSFEMSSLQSGWSARLEKTGSDGIGYFMDEGQNEINLGLMHRVGACWTNDYSSLCVRK